MDERNGSTPAADQQAVWLTEPDNSEWITGAGYRARLIRHPYFLHLNGYIEVPAEHPLHGVSYNQASNQASPFLTNALRRRMERPLGDQPSFAALVAVVLGGDLEARPDVVFEVHGGLTFSGSWTIAGPWPEIKTEWWFGFDTGHCDDYQPGMPSRLTGGTYRDIAYVFAECERLAAQLKEIE